MKPLNPEAITDELIARIDASRNDPAARRIVRADLLLLLVQLGEEARGSKSEDTHTESVAYDQFKIIAQALRSKKGRGVSLEETIRASLFRSSGRADFALQELRKHWYYLRRAIETIDSTSMPKDEVPYRIAAVFSRLTQSRSALDMLREEEERL